ncbi:SUMO-activating enzyme subunit 1 [Schistosoma haematobium]|uniref:SUMO-activating enzyme subunit 1 n=1 Tax=Schistosoma haematobium TaxID=6185 RepID=A0A922IRG9_SCHHA|nr:SUMO-activating enzyme subunit 1 [Schistosoma haematobium]KAH9585408.1 SUMO-activating enzyme subunit 1 [Schistosoma haematobium]CAH8518580.1 unnamed protein product [Schistosoma haematobium]CAH8521902.1 unnamed protein product [Schistosoma haematobium]
MVSDNLSNNLITEEEAELYDRQIRLWGIESQNRLKQSKVLLLGMNALAAEIAKNIVLAGISSLTIIDGQQVTNDDLENNFLIPRDSVGLNRADAVIGRTQSLNPMVKVQSSELGDDLKDKFQEYNLIILITECSSVHFKQWSTICGIVSSMDLDTRPYIICASVTGLFGLAFIDLGAHECLSEDVVVKKRSVSELSSGSIQKINKASEPSNTETVLVKKTFNYCHLLDSSCLISNMLKNRSHAKYIPKGYFLMQVLSQCSIEEAPFTLPYLQSQWQKVSKILDVDETILSIEDLECCSGATIPAVNPVLGGVVSQEIIRAITRKGAPHGNWYFFNGSQCSVTVDWLPPDEKS